MSAKWKILLQYAAAECRRNYQTAVNNCGNVRLCYPKDERTILFVIRRVITAVYARQWSRDADKVRRQWLGTLIAFSVAIRGNLTGLPMARIDVHRVYLRSNEYIGTFLLNMIWHTEHRPRFPLIDASTKLKLVSLRRDCAGWFNHVAERITVRENYAAIWFKPHNLDKSDRKSVV